MFDVARQIVLLQPLTATTLLELHANASRGGLPQNPSLVTFVAIW